MTKPNQSRPAGVPYLGKERKEHFGLTMHPTLRDLLKQASKLTGITQGAYLERALCTQLVLDHIVENEELKARP